MKSLIITTLHALATCLFGRTARSHILTMASALAMFLAQAALAIDKVVEQRSLLVNGQHNETDSKPPRKSITDVENDELETDSRF